MKKSKNIPEDYDALASAVLQSNSNEQQLLSRETDVIINDMSFAEKKKEIKAKKPRDEGLLAVKNEYYDTPETIHERQRREKEWVYSGRWAQGDPVKDIVQKTTYILSHPLSSFADAKSGISEFKLKLQASKYGIPPEKFDMLKESGRLHEVYEYVVKKKKEEIELDEAQKKLERMQAEAQNIQAQAFQRIARAEQIGQSFQNQQPDRLVKFGYKGMLGEETPIYVNAPRSTIPLRSKLLIGPRMPGQSHIANPYLLPNSHQYQYPPLMANKNLLKFMPIRKKDVLSSLSLKRK
ncbi:MAG: hypothetical protein N3E47_05010 [Candidatus Bathyarchaeota archaeon]|nr:hypothetical protein [Candidatus Bathyarchaeota archaeon]